LIKGFVMTAYQHSFSSGEVFPHNLGKVVCVGRNYADHAKELNNPIPKQPLLFIKPATAAVAMEEVISIPSDKGECHHELEMAVLIGQRLMNCSVEQARQAVAGVGLGLDLTLRDIQAGLKEKGQPWERAKAFDGSCPLSVFLKPDVIDLHNASLQLSINDELRQSGNTADMLFSVVDLLTDISQVFTLLPGDVVLTGTPAGVGPLLDGDQLKACLGAQLVIETGISQS
jgi:2-keto-4-pentenoate hydratase/2-oxohepta-3-ene-1,7-dioic acid hydratase in catechol pathway